MTILMQIDANQTKPSRNTNHSPFNNCELVTRIQPLDTRFEFSEVQTMEVWKCTCPELKESIEFFSCGAKNIKVL